MKKAAILFLLFISCAKPSREWPGTEMIWIELDKPGMYHWAAGEDPYSPWKDYECQEGPCTVIIKGDQVTIKTEKPITKAVHLTGEYGHINKELELLTPTSFKAVISEPRPYGEVFRIFF